MTKPLHSQSSGSMASAMGRDKESLSSSPDPIAISGSGSINHTTRPTRADSLTPKRSFINTNGNIRLQDFYLTTPPAGVTRSSSPIKSIAQTENLVSPWRIRVTVEAEKDEGQGTRTPSKSPSKRLAGRTITTTVPLKGAYSSSPIQAKRGRGRPRKSVDTPIKRISTPGPKVSARRRIGPVIVDGIAETAIQNTTQPKKARGRPRKSIGMQIGVQDTVDGARREAQSSHGTTIACQPSTPCVSTKKKSRGREESVDRYKEDLCSDRIAHFKATCEMVQESAPSYNSEVDDQMRPISSQSKQKWSDTQPQTKSDIDVIPTAPVTMNFDATGAADDFHATRQNLGRLKKPNSLADSHAGHKRGNSLQDPTELHHEFDSILESEGFSMVSVSTLPSAHLRLSSVSEVQEPGIAAQSNYGQTCYPKRVVPDIEVVEGLKETFTSQVSALPSSMLEKTINTSLLDFTPSPPSASHGSSQLYQVNQQQTPSQMFSSPSLPPPLQPAAPAQSRRALDKPTEGTPKLNRVVRAGNALQGILDPIRPSAAEPSSRSVLCTSSSTTRFIRQGQDDIFSGFGAGTRRELRAGLRLGEELGRRQHLAAEAAAAAQRIRDDGFREDLGHSRPKSTTPPKQEKYTLNMPCIERTVEYPNLPNRQLPSPERSDPDEEDERMSWKADPPAKTGFEDGTELRDWSLQDGMKRDLDRTRLAREAEWQLEREAVSRRIQQANTSQVIVIDSSTLNQSEDGTEDGRWEEEEVEGVKDGEDPEEEMAGADDGETIDIWQSEAQQSSRLEQSTSYEVPEVLFPDEVVKPRRSKLPSPWRRHSKLVYSDEAEPANEAVLRLPDLKHAVTPQESERRKRSRLDVSNYSTLSEFAVKPDDESTRLLGTELSFVKTVEEETPVKKTKVPRSLSHSEYYAKTEDDIDDTWTLGDTDLDGKDSPASNPGPATAAMKAESWEKVSTNGETAPTATSWLSRVTSYVPLWRSLAPKTRADSSLSLVSSNSPVYSPKSPPTSDVLSIYLPWTNVHYRTLRRFYLTAKRDKRLYTFNPDSSSAHLFGQEMCSMGWKKPAEKWELGVVDAFLDHLDAVGVEDGGLDEDGTERLLIDELEVARRVFSLWVGAVQRQEAPVGNGTVGMFDVRHQWRKAAVLKAVAEGR